VPLIVLTADRPPELRDRGAPQAIDQVHLYGRFAKWFADLPVPEAGSAAEAHVRGTVARAVAVALAAPAGPVQLNLPYREPLVPAGSLRPVDAALATASGPTVIRGDQDTGSAFSQGLPGQRRLPAAALDDLAGRLAAAQRGVIVCGPLDEPGFAPAVVDLAARCGFPVLADGLANVRFGAHERSSVIAHADQLLRVPAFAARHAPDLVVRFGGTPTSRALMTWLAETAAPQVVVDDGGWNEPTLLPHAMVQAEPVTLARDLATLLPPAGPGDGDTLRAWLASWLAAEAAAAATTHAWLAELSEPFEGQVLADLAASLPSGATLFVGNSMPVRDLDAFGGSGPAALRCLGNRGANGIDGLASTLLGLAAAHDGPVVGVVGDLSFLHDLGALVAARRLGLRATLVVIDNDGGGIFSFLPQAGADDPAVGLPEHFEALFGTPHGLDIGAVARAFGAQHEVIDSRTVAAAVGASLGLPGLRILQVNSERQRNVALHRDLQATVADALGAMLALPGRPASGKAARGALGDRGA
jgi:2-succinyl-5-enolpyruvyl-6-hydroxy-3-cyclohexene-1-carboxylate synthase